MPEPRAFPKLTDRLPLGSAGLEVSPICLGMSLDPMVIPAAFEAGINFFFLSADMHWPLYEAVRQGLAMVLAKPSARDSIVVGVVSYVTQAEFCWAPFAEVLDAVPELQRIDLTIAGGSYGHEIGRRLEIYKEHRSTRYLGARAIGASFHDRVAARAAVVAGEPDLAFVRYNPPHPKARTEVFADLPTRASGRRTLLYNFKSTVGHLASEEDYVALGIGTDFWRPHITDYYRFALTEPALDGLLIGLPDPGAVQELADALERGPLVEDDHQYLLDLGELMVGRAKLAT